MSRGRPSNDGIWRGRRNSGRQDPTWVGQRVLACVEATRGRHSISHPSSKGENSSLQLPRSNQNSPLDDGLAVRRNRVATFKLLTCQGQSGPAADAASDRPGPRRVTHQLMGAAHYQHAIWLGETSDQHSYDTHRQAHCPVRAVPHCPDRTPPIRWISCTIPAPGRRW